MEKRKRRKRLTMAILISTVLLAGSALAAPDKAQVGKTGKRMKVIDFDDEVVESMNKRPLDSLNQISEQDRSRRKAHLYRKRAGFKNETRETLDHLRYQP